VQGGNPAAARQEIAQNRIWPVPPPCRAALRKGASSGGGIASAVRKRDNKDLELQFWEFRAAGRAGGERADA
jgi:hypothetical protein